MNIIPMSLKLPVLAFGLCCLLPLELPAQEFSKIAIVDYNSIIKEYYKAKDSEKQFMDLAGNYQKERNEKDAKLKMTIESFNSLQKDLQEPGLTDAKKKDKEGQLRQKSEEAQVMQREMVAFAQTASKILDDKRQRLNQEVIEDINKVLGEVAKNKYTMVFVKPQFPGPGALIYSEGIDDLTQQVLTVLNKNAPPAKKEEKK